MVLNSQIKRTKRNFYSLLLIKKSTYSQPCQLSPRIAISVAIIVAVGKKRQKTESITGNYIRRVRAKKPRVSTSSSQRLIRQLSSSERSVATNVARRRFHYQQLAGAGAIQSDKSLSLTLQQLRL